MIFHNRVSTRRLSRFSEKIYINVNYINVYFCGKRSWDSLQVRPRLYYFPCLRLRSSTATMSASPVKHHITAEAMWSCPSGMAERSCQGHTFTREPRTKPISTSMVERSQRASSQCRNLANASIPTTQPNAKTKRVGKSRALTALII